MFRLLLCDDEGIVREGIKFLIDRAFPDTFIIEEAKSGRIAIEKAVEFRPDIIFMDIQMPGINGIDAMKEIRTHNKAVEFIVLTAYDRFTYAKDAIDIGVLEYLTKPINKSVLSDTLGKAITKINERKAKISLELEVKERLDQVEPIIESGFVTSVIIHDYDIRDLEHYKNLLRIEEEYGYILFLKYGDEAKEGGFQNPVGTSMQAQKSSELLREIIREFIPGACVAVLGNRAIAIVPFSDIHMTYEQRVYCVDRLREMLRKLQDKVGLQFRAGVGDVTRLCDLTTSYLQARKACKQGISKVNHVLDLPIHKTQEADYPYTIEDAIFVALQQGKQEDMLHQCELFIEWMQLQSKEPHAGYQLKIIELVLRAEAYTNHRKEMQFIEERSAYLDEILSCDTFSRIKGWFLEKMSDAFTHMDKKAEERVKSGVSLVLDFMEQNYASDLTLDDMSKIANMSPYYFSKIFKEDTGTNFVDYLNGLRIQHAQELLKDSTYSIKEICALSGYSDPNYFSRVFKKRMDMTPKEYREKVKHL